MAYVTGEVQWASPNWYITQLVEFHGYTYTKVLHDDPSRWGNRVKSRTLTSPSGVVLLTGNVSYDELLGVVQHEYNNELKWGE